MTEYEWQDIGVTVTTSKPVLWRASRTGGRIWWKPWRRRVEVRYITAMAFAQQIREAQPEDRPLFS